MKVAFVTINCIPANLTGSDEFIRVIAKHLAIQGHDVSILASNIANALPHIQLPPSEIIDGINIRRFWMFRFANHVKLMKLLLPFFFGRKTTFSDPSPSKDFSTPPQPSKIKQVVFRIIVKGFAWLISPSLFIHLLRSDYDVIHVTAFPHTHIWLTVYAAHLAGIPVVLSPAYHVETQSSMAWQLKYLARSCTKLAVYTEKECMDLESIGIPKEKIHVIPPGIEPQSADACSGKRFRDKYKLGDAPIVLFAGSKSTDKGYTHLVEAMRIVQKVIPTAVFVSIGHGSDALHAETLQKLPNSINLGYVPVQEKNDAFAACSIFAMPSRSDSFGIVYTEAWLQKKPVIGARCGSIPWIIHDGIDGLLVAFGNVDELAHNILSLLKDPDRCETLGTAGYMYVNNNYLAPIVSHRLANYYQSF